MTFGAIWPVQVGDDAGVFKICFLSSFIVDLVEVLLKSSITSSISV